MPFFATASIRLIGARHNDRSPASELRLGGCYERLFIMS